LAETRARDKQEEPFSGKIAEVFNITGQPGTFVLVEETTGRPRTGQKLEVMRDGAVIGTLVLSGVEPGLRPREEGLVALHFKNTAGVQLERGLVLRTPPPTRVLREMAEDRFAGRLRAFNWAVGWTTLAGVIVAALAWVFYAVYTARLLGSAIPRWLDGAWLPFSVALSVLVVGLAGVWLVAALWHRRLTHE